MSYYQFQGPVQGGFGGFGPGLMDDEQRRRRKHYQDPGRPYTGGVSAPPVKMPAYELEIQASPPAQAEQAPSAGPAAPRQAAAVDMGAGPVQQSIPDPGIRDFREREYSPDMPERMTNVVADLQEQKRRAAALFEEDEPVAAVPLVATGGMPPQRPGKGDEDPEDDPRAPRGRPIAPRPRVPHRDPRPDFGGPPLGPQGPPAARPAPGILEPEPIGTAAPVVKLPEPVQPRRRLREPGPSPVSAYGRIDPMTGTSRGVPFGPQTGVRRKVGRHGPGRGGAGYPYAPGGGPPGGGPPGPPGPPGGPSGPGKKKDPRKVRWGKDETREFHGGRAIHPWDPSEKEKRRGYQQYGQMQGRELARREHQIVLEKMRKQNRNLITAMQQRGGQQIDARERKIAGMQQQGELLEARVGAGIQQLGARDRKIAGMQQAGETLEARMRAGSKQLSARDRKIAEQGARIGAGTKQLEARDTEITRKQARIDALLQEGRSLDASGRKQVEKLRAEIDRLNKEGTRLQEASRGKVRALQEGMGREGIRAQRAEERAADLLKDGNRRIQELEKKIDDGKVSRATAQSEIDKLTKQLADAARAPAPAQRDDLKNLRDDIAGLRKAVKGMPRGGPAAAPIVVQGGAGGGGASSSAGGSSAAAGGAPAAGPARTAPDLSKVVEAMKQIAEGAKKKGAGSGTKGITQARRSYTDKRKAKIAELRALKSKRIREFSARTKKMPKAERTKQRREYKKKVEAQFKEMQTRFPTARGLKSVGVIRELIRKIDAFKAAK